MHTILMADDDDSCAGLLTKALTAAGYAVVRAGNGREALERYDPRVVSLVLTDLFMPDMDGIELITQLQALDPSVRIIAMSGGSFANPQSYLPMAERLGAVKTLAKPFQLEELKLAIKECLDIA